MADRWRRFTDGFGPGGIAAPWRDVVHPHPFISGRCGEPA